MENVISVEIGVEIITNKGNTKVAFDNYFEAAEWLWDKLTDEQRLSLPRCHSCGSLDTTCQCWNDD